MADLTTLPRTELIRMLRETQEKLQGTRGELQSTREKLQDTQKALDKAESLRKEERMRLLRQQVALSKPRKS